MYDTVVQRTEHTWHIPLHNGEWLCATDNMHCSG